jgi:uncharacterized protein involved in outer membrane biogenesis
MAWLGRWLMRLGKLAAALIVLAVILVVGFFSSLPEIVRQVAVRQVPKAIGRQLSIEDIDLNLFTGYIAVKKLRLAERAGSEAFVEFERLEGRLALRWLVKRNIRVTDFRLVGPMVRVVRGQDGQLNFQDLLPSVKQADIAREPTKWTFTVDHAAIERGRLIVEDRAVSPAADWSVRDLEIETFGVSTRPDSPPGRLKGSLRTGTAALDIRWDKFQQAPVKVSGSVKLTGFDLTRVRPYLPPPLRGTLASGAVGIGLDVEYTRTDEGFQAAVASGDVTVENVALAGEGAKEPPLAMTRLGVGLKRFDLTGREVTLSKVELSGLDVRVRRDKSGAIDLLSLVAKPSGETAPPQAEPVPAPAPAAPPPTEPAPKPWKVGVERFTLGAAKVTFTDESVEPAVRFSAVVGSELGVQYGPTAEGVPTVLATGDVTVENVALARPATKETLVTLGRLAVGLKHLDVTGQEVTLSKVELSGLDARLRRDKSGQIDLLAIAGSGGEASPPAPKAVPVRAPAASKVSGGQPAPKPWKVGVERTRLGGAKVTFTDETVTPAVELTVSKLDVAVDNVTWPVRGPASLSLSAGMPGAGTIKVQGPVTFQPFDAQLAISLRDAAIEPYQSYMPVPARFTGRFNGDSKNHIAIKDGRTILSSKGTSWADAFEAKMPGAEAAMIVIERMDLVDIDFDWPTKAIVGKAGFKRMSAEIERAEDGSFNIVKAFGGPAAPSVPDSKEAPAPAATKPAPPAPAPAAPAAPAPATAAKPKGLLETMELQFREIRLEEGSLRFIDRGTEPDFSEDFSKMDLTVTDLGNKPDQKAKLVFTTVVGGDGGLEIRGDIGALGAPLYLDLVGEIRDLALPAVNPYSDKAIAWLIKQGDLKYKFTLKVENDQLTATNEIVVGKLRVAKAKQVDDQVKSRLGLPLGLIVALIKDSNGNIVLNVPISGSLKDPKFDLSDVIWSSIKNVLVNVLTSPFRLIGSLFSKGDKIEEPKVNPVTFPAGSVVLTPSMEEHLLRVADFMRRTPYVTLTMHPVVAPADLEALKSTEVAARLQQFAKEKGISDPPKIVAAYFKEKMPDEKPPKTVEEQLRLLREREAVPEAKVKEIQEQRVTVTRERLVKKEGIQDKRLIPGEANKPPSGTAEGMVEFTVGGSEE